MSALSADRNTLRKSKVDAFKMGVKASTTIYAGSIVAVTSGTGWAIPATDTASLIVMGVATHGAVGSATEGAVALEVETGVFKFAASSVTAANIGQNATIVDDQTVGVAAGTTNDIVVGKILDIDADGGVWVKVG